MPTEPRMWLALDKVREVLAGIAAGADYHYTPHAVYVVTSWVDPRLWNDAVANAADPSATIYAVRRTDRLGLRHDTGDNSTGSQFRTTSDVTVLVSRRFNPSADDDTPGEAQIIERMLADVLRRMAFEYPGLDSVNVDDVVGEGYDDNVVVDADEGWAAGQQTYRLVDHHMAVRP